MKGFEASNSSTASSHHVIAIESCLKMEGGTCGGRYYRCIDRQCLPVLLTLQTINLLKMTFLSFPIVPYHIT